MLHIVTGGAGSGKSAYAEALVLQEAGKKRFYIATMRPWDEECIRRIRKHQRMRREKGFETLEMYGRIQGKTFSKDSVVLLECLSNLLANLWGCPEYEGQELAALAAEDLLCLEKQVKTLVIVTNEVFSDHSSYDEETENYRRLLGELNQRLAAQAASVTEVVYGIPVKIR